jgi:hypothetical protein
MKLSKFTLPLAFLALFGSSVFAQEYEADVDSAWVASQNGGQALESEPANEEPAPACIGDGCDGTETAAESAAAEPAAEPTASSESAEQNEAAATGDSTQVTDSTTTTAKADSTVRDSTKKTASVVKITEENEDDYEECTEADSTNTECVEVDETATYDRYLQENAEMYRARKEGFSRSIQIGLRATGGMNTVFGKKSDDWGFGYQAGGGILVRLPIGIRHVSLVPELDFVYRKYNYESKNEYSKTEGGLDYMLFEIPILLRYTFDEDNFFVGVGMNLDLKLTGSSEITQKTKETGEKDKRKNTLPSSGVELGGAFNIGYAINRWLIADIRVVQCFTNLLNEDAIAESSLSKAHLYTFYTSLGLTFVF